MDGVVRVERRAVLVDVLNLHELAAQLDQPCTSPVTTVVAPQTLPRVRYTAFSRSAGKNPPSTASAS